MRSIIALFALPLAISAPALASEVMPVPAFRAVELRGGGDVNLLPGAAQRVVVIEGSTHFTRFRVENDGKLVIDVCNKPCPHNYHLRLQIESPHVPALAVAGGGAIRAGGGFAPQADLNTAVMGGGMIDAHGVEAANVTAAIHDGGKIFTRPRSVLTAAINGGGEILYSGNPAVTSAVQGGGAVRRAD